MSKSGYQRVSEENVKRFAEAYNDKAKHPRLRDVATALNYSYQTVRNRAVEIRAQFAAAGLASPLISRAEQPKPKQNSTKVEKERPAPAEIARTRAAGVRHSVYEFFQGTNYPVLNPEALVIEERTTRRWSSSQEAYIETDTTPRTWLTDTLRVAGYDDLEGRAFLFTSAQNDSELHEGFWQNLVAFADAEDAHIVVGPLTYETNWWDENNPAARDYDDRLIPHLCFGQMPLGEKAVFCGEMNTLPTAPRPVQDLTHYTKGRWGFFPHPRLQLISVPSTNPGEQAYHVMTTGSVTKPKVLPRKAGIKALDQNVFGAVFVTFDAKGNPFPRQILPEVDGSFYDLDRYVSGGEITTGHRVRAITAADLHLAKAGRRNTLATFGYYADGTRKPGSLIEALDPEHILIEDGHDNEKGSHHREFDVHHHFEMAERGRDKVRDEVRTEVAFLQRLQKTGRQVHVVESNHDVHLERYIREARYRDDGGHNLEFGLELELAYTRWRKEVARCLDEEIRPPKFSLLEWSLRNEAKTTVEGALGDIHWIYDGSDSFILDGIELGHHGHRGSNGSFGTPAGFARLGRNMTIGDKHSPSILDGVYVAGALELQHGYNKGPSGWSVTHCIQYPNGKRTLITLHDGEWRAPARKSK